MGTWAELAGYPWGETDRAMIAAVMRCDSRGESEDDAEVEEGVVRLSGAWLRWIHQIGSSDVYEFRRARVEGLLVDAVGECCWAVLPGDVMVRMCELEEAMVVWEGPEAVGADWTAGLSAAEIDEMEGGRT